jgi:hypothetical protein
MVRRMTTMKKYLLILLASYFTLVTFTYADSVEATVNTQEVIEGNPVTLRIKAIGGAAAFPKIDQIDGSEVTTLGTSRQSSMKITSSGMKSETSTVKKYSFVPQKDMVIPSYSVRIGKELYKTKPIQIKVVKSQAPTVQTNGQFDFQLKTDKSSITVGESFVMTLYMSIDNDLKGIKITEYVAPTASDFFIKEVAGQKEYVNGGYTVIEKQYILTSKKEGNFTVSPAAAKLGQPDWSRQDIFGRPGMTWRPIASNPLKIEVKPLDVDADLIGEFEVETSLDSQSVKANKPVNLKLKIAGKGSLEDFEFPKYEIDGVTVYSDEAKIESNLEGSELESVYEKGFAFISEDDFSIPAREVKVYNPKSKTIEVLKIPGYDVKVTGTKRVAVPTLNTAQIKKEIIEKERVVRSVDWWMILLAYLLGMLTLYLIRFLPRLGTRKSKSYKESEALKILYGHISEETKVEEMVRKLYAKKRGDKSVSIDKKELKEMVEKYRS